MPSELTNAWFILPVTLLYIALGLALGTQINHFVGRLVRYLSAVLVLVTVYDVTLRYVFESGSVAIQELEWHIFSALFLLGAGWTFVRDDHVRVDILYSRLGTRGKALIDIGGTLLFLFPFCVMVIYVSVPFMLRSFAVFESSADPGGLPLRGIVKSFILLGFLLLGLEGLAQLRRNISLLVNKDVSAKGTGRL